MMAVRLSFLPALVDSSQITQNVFIIFLNTTSFISVYGAQTDNMGRSKATNGNMMACLQRENTEE